MKTETFYSCSSVCIRGSYSDDDFLTEPDYHFNVGYVLWKRGEFERAAESFRAVLARNPEDAAATLLLGRCLKRAGPRTGDSKSVSERLKLNYEEAAWRQLKAALGREQAPPK